MCAGSCWWLQCTAGVLTAFDGDTYRAKEEALLQESVNEAAAAEQYQALLAAQDAERQAALQAMYTRSAARAAMAGEQASTEMLGRSPRGCAV